MLTVFNWSAGESFSYFLTTSPARRHIARTIAAMTGPMIHMRPASSRFLFTDTSELSTGTLGFGLLGGSPGGTSLMSRASGSENGLDVYKCWKFIDNFVKKTLKFI